MDEILPDALDPGEHGLPCKRRQRRRLFNRDYQVQSPFNTYLIEALPPHAIGQPSAASIEAALYPRQSDFLFFVAGPGRKHIFSRTYREHQAAIRQIRMREPATR